MAQHRQQIQQQTLQIQTPARTFAHAHPQPYSPPHTLPPSPVIDTTGMAIELKER